MFNQKIHVHNVARNGIGRIQQSDLRRVVVSLLVEVHGNCGPVRLEPESLNSQVFALYTQAWINVLSETPLILIVNLDDELAASSIQ
jgi:hypothetical protein